MKTLISAAAAAALLFAFSGCTESTTEPVADNPLLATPVPDGMVRGTVSETMNSGGYTYVLLESGDRQVWIAGPVTAVQVGDILQASTGMAMTEFTSNTLNRTFDVVYFSGALQNLSSPAPTPAPAAASSPEPVAVDVEIAPVEDGKDIAWVHDNKANLAGQSISLRGKVVKYNANILGWNFVHIRDGSGDAADGSNDLTVTTTAEAALGQTIVATGTIVLDKDFSAGYLFPVLMEDASVTVEP